MKQLPVRGFSRLLGISVPPDRNQPSGQPPTPKSGFLSLFNPVVNKEMSIKKGFFILVILAGFLAVTLPSYAAFIDFETNPAGITQTNNGYIGDAYDILGVNLRSEGYNRPAWRSGVYGGDGWFIIGGGKWLGGYSYDKDHIGIDFTVPASEVSFDLFSGTGAQLWAYDGFGTQIINGASLSLYGHWTSSPYLITSINNIGRVEIKATTFNTVLAMDNLSFTSPVPAPPPLLLLGSSLIALVGFRRKWVNAFRIE